MFYDLAPIGSVGEFVQLRPLPIADHATNKALDDLSEACFEIRKSIVSTTECWNAGPHCVPLNSVRLALLSNLRSAYKNGVRSILRGYLYDLQPRDFLA